MKPLFFSRLLLEPVLRDLYAVHQTLWTGFPDQTERPFLFRADRVLVSERARVWKVLVQAKQSADWSRAGDGIVEQTQTGARELAFREGEQLRFFLRANATVSKKGRPNMGDLDEEAFHAARGVRVGLRGEDAERAWLDVRAEAAGFRVHAVRIVGRRRERWSHDGKHGVHDGVDFEGHLIVDDPVRFGAVIDSGIGRGRAFGFGLLSVARDGG